MTAPPGIYQDEVDFTALALRYPEFAKRLKPNRQLDFSDPESVRQLTKALLHRDFDITINLPEDRLCPPVPNRFNYILFAQRLLDSTYSTYNEAYDLTRKVIGLDIGTGASAIYPLLACRQHQLWYFLATEIDEKSREFAERNIRRNNLHSRIKLIDTDPTGKAIVPSAQLEQFERIDILLTNPPFYTSESELEALAKQKSRPPNSACTGAPIEMICPGGETAFVSQLVKESTYPQNKHRIQWFSSMLGKLGSVTIIIDRLRIEGCTNYAVTEFVQGQKTRRWCVAWSWLSLRPSQAVARGTDAVEKRYLPFPTELQIPVNLYTQSILSKLNTELSSLQGLEWKWRPDFATGVGRSIMGDVWSRHARRKLKKLMFEDQDPMDIEDPHSNIAQKQSHMRRDMEKSNQDRDTRSEPDFVFKITSGPPGSVIGIDASDSDATILTLRWLQGQDSKLFESFHGWLKRKLTQ